MCLQLICIWSCRAPHWDTAPTATTQYLQIMPDIIDIITWADVSATVAAIRGDPVNVCLFLSQTGPSSILHLKIRPGHPLFEWLSNWRWQMDQSVPDIGAAGGSCNDMPSHRGSRVSDLLTATFALETPKLKLMFITTFWLTEFQVFQGKVRIRTLLLCIIIIKRMSDVSGKIKHLGGWNLNSKATRSRLYSVTSVLFTYVKTDFPVNFADKISVFVFGETLTLCQFWQRWWTLNVKIESSELLLLGANQLQLR